MKTYRFAVGINGHRTVTVKALSLDDAMGKARAKLDAIAERLDQDPPASWDLTVMEIQKKIPRGTPFTPETSKVAADIRRSKRKAA